MIKIVHWTLFRILAKRVLIYRAVLDFEGADILAARKFNNPLGCEVKYFTRSIREAQRYAQLATDGFGEGPFRIVMTSIERKLISDEMTVGIESGIRSVVLPTALLPSLTRPVFVTKRRAYG